MSNPELLRELFKKYNLFYDKDDPDNKANDVYKHKHYTIITRQGIQKIEKASGITCKIDVVPAATDPTHVTMVGIGAMGDQTYTTYASASPETSKNAYYAEMAEKRCRSRLILTLAGLYELGVFGEDESDSFSEAIKTQQSSPASSVARYKGQ